jgi:MFS family permease
LFKKVFKAFQYREFRILWLGACTSSIGTWMQKLAQSWLVYQLSDSKFMLGLDAFLGEIPIFLFSLIGGVIADRFDRRKLLLGSQFVQMACAFLLASVFASGLLKVWHILCLSFTVGLAQSFGGPAYSAIVPSLVDKEDLPNAIALNSIQFNLARVIGPMLGGLALTKLGASWCFSLNGLSFIAVIISLLLLKLNYLPINTGGSMLASMKEGINFIRTREAMTSLVAMAFLTTFLGIPIIVFLPAIAKDVFHADSQTYTWLLSISGFGAVAGAIIVAASGHVKQKGRLALVMLCLFGGFMMAFALSSSLPFSFLMLFLAGAAMIAVFTMVTSLVQLITANEMRGRVMSAYNVAFRGGMPFGSFMVGAMTKFYPLTTLLAINGALMLLIGIYLLTMHRKVANL